MAKASYVLRLSNNSTLNVAVPRGTTSRPLSATISASFTPVSAISSVGILSASILNDDGFFSAVGTNVGSIPVNLTNSKWTGSSQVITLSTIYDNTTPKASEKIIDAPQFYLGIGVAELSSGSTDTLWGDASTSYFISDGDAGQALSAEEVDIVYDFTPELTAANTSVAYGTSSTLIGSATFTTSSQNGNNTGISAVGILGIYISGSGSDADRFTSVSANVSFPATGIELGDFAFSTVFNNTYLHGTTEYKTINVVVSTDNTELSAGWVNGPYVPGTTDFTAGTYTLTALGDAGAPSGVTGFVVTPMINKNKLDWVNPIDADLSGVQIQYALSAAPSAYTEGTRIYKGPGTSTFHNNLTSYVPYYYSVFTFDNVGKYSTTPVSAVGTPIYNQFWHRGALVWEEPAETIQRWYVEGIV